MKVVDGKIKLRFMGAFALIFVLIAGGCSFSDGTGADFNKEGPIRVNSGEDFANRIVPGWQRAQEAGQIVDVGILKPILGTDAVVTFEKVWYNSSNTYVLYTVKEPNKQYLMADKRDINVSPDEESVARNFSLESLDHRWGGISSEGYHQVK